MEECRDLCKACGMEVVGEISQQSENPDPRTAFRSGKLKELTGMKLQLNAESVVFTKSLSIAATDRISAICDIEVIDRTSLILQIFSKRAKTRQAKLQVEIARWQYALPRLKENSEIESHERGGAFSNRGAGEQRSAVIKRQYQHRIKELKEQLKALEKENHVAENRRRKSLLKRVALVGYTNAGKSSFMNAVLTYNHQESRGVLEKDMLFATLDTSVRNIRHKSYEFLLYDTVGFVSDLPHELIEAFKSTLSSAKDADLLIHIIDASDPRYEEKMEITQMTLNQIGAGDIPIIHVYNKIDLLKEEKHFGGYRISCKSGEGLDKTLDAIVERLYPNDETMRCLVPYDHMTMLSASRRILQVREIEHREDGLIVELSGQKEHLHPYRKYSYVPSETVERSVVKK